MFVERNFVAYMKSIFLRIFLLFSSSQTNFQLEMPGKANNNLSERIKKTLEVQLKECQHFNFLPSSINLSATLTRMYQRKLTNAKKFYSKTYYETHKAIIFRCKKLRKVLPYAQKILC